MEFLLPNWTDENQNLEFDNVLNLTEVLLKGDETPYLLLANYLPLARYLLHKYEMLEVPYWSAFDAIQMVDRQQGFPLGLRDLKFSATSSVIYMHRTAQVYEDDRLVAIVRFGIDSVMSSVDYFENETIVKKELYDDRGFVSKLESYVDGHLASEEWLTTAGHVVITKRHDSSSSDYMVAEEYQSSFKRQRYGSLNEVVAEKLNQFLTERGRGADVVIGQFNQRVFEILSQVEIPQRVVYFADINTDQVSVERLRELIQKHRQIVVSTTVQQQQLLAFEELSTSQEPENDLFSWDFNFNQQRLAEAKGTKEQSQIQMIPKYNTDFSIGQSNSTDVMYIYWNLGQTDSNRIMGMLPRLLAMVDQFDDRGLMINFNGVVNGAVIAEIKKYANTTFEVNVDSSEFKKVVKYTSLKKRQDREDAMRIKAEIKSFSNLDQLTKAAEFINRILLNGDQTKLEMDRNLSIARLLLDLGSPVNSYLQMTAISTGIPQINAVNSEFIQNKKNGYVITDRDDEAVIKAINYYLDSLYHWNIAVVENSALIEKYASSEIIQRWKGVVASGSES